MHGVSMSSTTNLSLLARLREEPDNQQGWNEFVQRYGPRIYSWCRRWGLQESDAEDVKQNVLLQISRQMKTFEYDPSGRFRSWLKTVAWRAWADFLKAQGRNRAQPNGADPTDQLYSVAGRDDLMREIEQEADRELLEIAIESVKPRVREHTWEAFRLMTYDHLSGAEVAKRLGMKEASVFVARGRVQKMLLEEVARLDQIDEDVPTP